MHRKLFGKGKPFEISLEETWMRILSHSKKTNQTNHCPLNELLAEAQQTEPVRSRKKALVLSFALLLMRK